MATVNLGRIKPVFRGAYNNSTAYVVDDIVTSGNETFICISASTGNATSNGTFWTKLAAKGADGTDVAATLANKEIAFKTNAGALDGIPIGTAGQILKVNSGATGYEFGAVSVGAYSIKQIYQQTLSPETHSGSVNTSYNFGTPIQVTPAVSTDLLDIRLQINFEGRQGSYNGLAIGVNTSDSWGTATNDSRLKVSSGEHAYGMGDGNDSERYQVLKMSGIYSLSELGMSAGTNYYISPHILTHSPSSGNVKTAITTSSYVAPFNRFDIIRLGV